jgi:hypothetical protein
MHYRYIHKYRKNLKLWNRNSGPGPGWQFMIYEYTINWFPTCQNRYFIFASSPWLLMQNIRSFLMFRIFSLSTVAGEDANSSSHAPPNSFSTCHPQFLSATSLWDLEMDTNDSQLLHPIFHNPVSPCCTIYIFSIQFTSFLSPSRFLFMYLSLPGPLSLVSWLK